MIGAGEPVAHAQGSVPDIRIYLDGNRVQSDTAPFIVPKANVTMVPMRVIGSGLGAETDWAQKTKTVTIRKPGKTIVMTIGQKYATVNGSRVALDTSVQLVNSRTMVPLRFVGEQLGLTVKWYGDTRTIALESEAAAELRGAWVSTVYNLDWPSKNSYGNAEQQKLEFTQLLDELQGIGLNTVFVQVRPTGDAFYPSAYAPWSAYLTGQQGKDPGYDPLAYMIEQAHARGMSFQAWFNPFRAAVSSNTAVLAPGHVALTHPEWIVAGGSGILYVNPGIPEARQYIIDTIMEVASKYPVDGIHLDDYFYPSSGAFDDSAAYAAYKGSQYATLGDWRRSNINDFVEKLGKAIHKAKPKLDYGISPFGVWRNAAVDPTGSDTRAGVTAYDDMNADVRTWIRQSWIDYVIPQVYWSQSLSVARYNTIASWWAKEVDGTGVKLYIGHAPYKLGTKETGWNSADEIINQLKYNETIPQIRGDVYFSAKDLRRNPLGLVPLLSAYYGAAPSTNGATPMPSEQPE
nr:family 10 glycosylhydrolase [Cohnella faecalis]